MTEDDTEELYKGQIAKAPPYWVTEVLGQGGATGGHGPDDIGSML